MKDDIGDTLLHHAALNNRPKHALWLMQNGVSALDRNHDGHDAARIAVTIESAVPVLKLVLDHNPESVSYTHLTLPTILLV